MVNFSYKKVLVVIALLFTFTLVYSPHLNYRFPFHVDEWWHTNKALDIKDFGIDFFTSDYFNPVEIGIQLILFIISLFINIVLVYKFLPAINAVIIVSVLFYFLSKKFNYWVGLVSIFVFASLRSNVNIMGLWFYVPVTAAIVFDYLCLFYLEKTVKEKNPKKIYYVALFLFLIAFIHPSSFLVMSLVIIIFLLFRYKYVKQNYRYFLPFLVLLIPAFFVLRQLTNKFSNLSNVFSQLVWGPNIVQINFNPVLFYGIILFIFGIIGFYLTYKKRSMLSFRIWIVIPLINIFIFPFINFTLFSSYQRYLYHFMIAAVPLSAIGIYAILKLVSRHIKSINVKKIIIILSFISILLIIFHNYYNLHPQTKLYRVIDEDDYEAMLFLKEQGNQSSLDSFNQYWAVETIAPRFPGTGIRTIARKSSLGAIFHKKEADESISLFYNGNCSEKKKIIDQYRYIKYIYSYQEIDCDYLKEIFRNKKVIMYQKI